MNFKMWMFSIRFKLETLLEKTLSKISSIASSLVFNYSIVTSKILSKTISEDILFMAIDFKMSKNLKTIKEMFEKDNNNIGFKFQDVKELSNDKMAEIQKKFVEEIDSMKSKTINNLKQKCSWLR